MVWVLELVLFTNPLLYYTDHFLHEAYGPELMFWDGKFGKNMICSQNIRHDFLDEQWMLIKECFFLKLLILYLVKILEYT